MRNAKENVSDGLVVAMILKGLPDEYKPFFAVTTQSDTVQNFKKFKQALRNFEDTEQSRSEKAERGANVVLKTKVGQSKIICYSCHTPGHKSSECKHRALKWCNYCKSSTHNDKVCRRQKDKAKLAASKGTEDNQHSYAFTITDENLIQASHINNFLVDCGATTHIVNKDDNFIYIDPSFNPEEHFVESADGSRSNNVAKKRGTVSIVLRSADGSTAKAALENALYIPSYPQCIFSVQAATRKGAKVEFERDSAVLITQDGNTFPIQQHGRLYYLCKTFTTEGRNETLEMWHKLLGHCNVEDVKWLEHVVQGMTITDSKLLQIARTLIVKHAFCQSKPMCGIDNPI